MGEDAYGRNKYMWTLQQRRIVAQAFIAGCRYHKAHWHLKQDTLGGMDERLIDVHLDHCRNVFEESKGCENQHPYVSLQREAERQTTAAPAAATARTNNSSNRMSVDPSRNSSNRMSVQAVAAVKEEGPDYPCWNCGRAGHYRRQCRKPFVPGGYKAQEQEGRLQGRGPPPPPRQERTREEDWPRQVQQVTAAPTPTGAGVAPSLPWTAQRVGVCTMPGSTVSIGINNIGNNVLLNLDVGPGERDINSVAGVAVCYETGQMTTYPLIIS